MGRQRRLLVVLLLAIILAAGFAVRIHNIHLPGPYQDEVIVPLATKHFLAQDKRLSYSVSIGGVNVPLSFSPHTGALVVYVDAIAALVSRRADHYYRYETISFWLVSTLLFFLLARKLLGEGAALLGVVVLSFLPSVVFYSRIAQHSLFLRNVFSAALLLALFRWMETRNRRLVHAAAFLAGLGMSYRLEIGWMGFAFLVIVAFDREVRRAAWDHVLDWRSALLSFALFLLGFGVVIANQIVNDMPLLRQIGRNRGMTVYGHDNTRLWHNVWERIGHVGELFEGVSISLYAAPGSNPVWPVLLVMALLASLLLAFRGRPDERPLARRLLLFGSTALFVSTFTVTASQPVHLLFLLYVPILVLLLGFLAAARRSRAMGLAVLVSVLVAVTIDLRNVVSYHRALEKTGGQGVWTSGLMDLVRLFRDTYPNHCALAGNWGIAVPLEYFLPPSACVAEVFGYENGYAGVPGSFYREVDRRMLGDLKPAFAFFAPGLEPGFLRRQAFIEHLDRQGIGYQRVPILDRSGQPLLDVFFPMRANGGAAVPAELDLEALFPYKVRAGETFNRQPDGKSAMALKVRGLRPGESYLVSIGGRARPATVGKESIISVIVERGETALPGDREVFVATRDQARRSNALRLTVVESGSGMVP
jgi:MFS family permease